MPSFEFMHLMAAGGCNGQPGRKQCRQYPPLEVLLSLIETVMNHPFHQALAIFSQSQNEDTSEAAETRLRLRGRRSDFPNWR